MPLKSAKEKLEQLFLVLDTLDKVLIIISPDPDALSSAWAFKRLLYRKVETSEIAYVREIKRPDNLAMIKLLRIPVQSLAKFNLGNYTKLAIIDSQPHHFQELENLAFDIIIDHHPFKKEGKIANFVDIAPEYGATATILTEYLRAAKIRPSTSLATALFYGIKTDTQNFIRRGTEKDSKAFRYLFNYVNKAILQKIETSEFSLKNLHYFKRAFSAMQVDPRRHRIFTFLGKVDSPDTCVILADFLLRIYEISWSVVAGLCKGHVIVIFRSDGYRRNAGYLAERAFGGLGSAGGHKEMARAEIPVENLKTLLPSMTNEAIENYILYQITKVGL